MKRVTYPTVEAKWASKTMPTEDGHLIWTGGHGPNGTPALDFHKKRHQAARISFAIRTGREPEGVVMATCDTDDCVHPRHVQDATERERDRALLRILRGYGPRPETCPNGHDQATDGRLDNEGHHYCNACNQHSSKKQVAS